MDPKALLDLLAVKPPAHLGFIYDPRDPWRQAALSFAARGLVLGECVTYFFTHGTGQTQAADLKKLGVDVEAAQARGQLTIMPSGHFYLTGGTFDPERQVRRVERALDQAIEQGYRQVRAVSEMDWAAGQDAEGLKLLAEYEGMLNERVFNRYPLSALCIYDRRRFDPRWQDMVCRRHPHLLSQAGIIHQTPTLS